MFILGASRNIWGNSGCLLSFIDFAHSLNALTWRIAATANSTDATLPVVLHFTFEAKKAVKCCKFILNPSIYNIAWTMGQTNC
jgi:hypothetical protein